jgi:hypothetical protein
MREAAHILGLMTHQPTPHFSFILRCWRDDSGLLRGQLIDAMTQQAHPFATLEELTRKISNLIPGEQPAPDPETGLPGHQEPGSG